MEPASVTVAGQPAQTAADNAFRAQAPVGSGTQNVVVTATDPSGNLRTNTYEVSTSGATTTYTYDSNGNLTQKTEGSDTWGYEWNARNELTRVTKNSVEQARFSYDSLGRRVEKVAGGVTTTYTYAGLSILREVRGATTLKYLHGGLDEPRPDIRLIGVAGQEGPVQRQGLVGVPAPEGNVGPPLLRFEIVGPLADHGLGLLGRLVELLRGRVQDDQL